ncbi:hypothetical protein NHF45_08770 [Maricaulaceae bacterium NA33B04]|nr:hypothetical protein [Maricaulaceae bacterium NA33B04]
MTSAAGTNGSEHRPLMEVRLHALSPLPPVLTGLCISMLLFGSYFLLASLVGQPVIRMTPEGAQFDSASWAAFVMSLVFAAALTMPAISQIQWQTALPELSAVLDEVGRQKAEAMAQGSPKARWIEAVIAFACGALGGLLVNTWLSDIGSMTLEEYFLSVRPWFDVANPVLFGLGGRAAQMLMREERDFAALIDRHLQVNLAGLDQNFVFGRLALRGALSWMVMTGIILLFFVESAPVPVSVGAVGLALLAAGYVFASSVGPVVRKCTIVRDEAVTEVRETIALAGQKALRGEAPPVALSELTAYETWLEKQPVWPISAPITRRLALYGLIPILAWFGAAAAELVLEGLTA